MRSSYCKNERKCVADLFLEVFHLIIQCVPALVHLYSVKSIHIEIHQFSRIKIKEYFLIIEVC